MRAWVIALVGVLLISPARAAGDEEAFIAAVTQARQTHKNAGNDMAKGAARGQRRAAICAILRSPRVTGWRGTIYKLSSNADGKGVLALLIAPNIYVQTWNNSVSDFADNTLIDHDSAVFKSAVAMKEGDAVIFSGSFLSSAVDCVKEASMTLDGSMTEPEFIFRFSSITPGR